MAKQLSDITVGLIELVEDVSHDPDEADWGGVHEYLEDIPNHYRVLKELVHWLHQELL